MRKPIKEWTPREIIDHMGIRAQPPVDKLETVRRVFADRYAQIEQACAQSRPPSSIELRRLEYLAAEAILKALEIQNRPTAFGPGD